jgi:hypothetical protein
MDASAAGVELVHRVEHLYRAKVIIELLRNVPDVSDLSKLSGGGSRVWEVEVGHSSGAVAVDLHEEIDGPALPYLSECLQLFVPMTRNCEHTRKSRHVMMLSDESTSPLTLRKVSFLSFKVLRFCRSTWGWVSMNSSWHNNVYTFEDDKIQSRHFLREVGNGGPAQYMVGSRQPNEPVISLFSAKRNWQHSKRDSLRG